MVVDIAPKVPAHTSELIAAVQHRGWRHGGWAMLLPSVRAIMLAQQRGN